MNKYEALGRYIEAKERYDKALRVQAMFTDKLKDAAEMLHSERSSQSCIEQNLQTVADLLEQCRQTQKERSEAAENVNEYALLCGKEKL